MSAYLFIAFLVLLGTAWWLEETRWQLSERTGLFVVLLSLPLFYLDWKYQLSVNTAREKFGVGVLAPLILFLSVVKLLQAKADRDWVFLYLISFFEILLAAGLSLSPLFLLTLALYMLSALSTIIAFEIKKARRHVKVAETRLLVAPDAKVVSNRKLRARQKYNESRRLPYVAAVLLLLIFILAIPLFFIAPRYGASAFTRTDSGLAGFIGFSDTVTLGDIGRLQQNDKVVMRVRVEGAPEAAERQRNLRWRGVALDLFTGRGWRKSTNVSSYAQANVERGFFQLGTTEGLHRLTTQIFFLEPIDSPVLFAASRAIALQGALPYVRQDVEGALSTRTHDLSRITYKVYSDTVEPDENLLRRDVRPIPSEASRYLQLPRALDPRISELARRWIAQDGARNRYDAARAIESHLRSDFHYTLDLKAGGLDPLADFLFRVREGHCEYFSTAMAVMLRTQGIATRVVNGFQTGTYNDAADAYTVTQRDAHSWVEVYFPDTDAWVTFDPTPAAGLAVSANARGLQARLKTYMEALELFWIQYVVAYDRQEQRSIASSMRRSLTSSQAMWTRFIDNLRASLEGFFKQDASNAMHRNFSRAKIPSLGLLTAVAFSSFLLLLRRVRRLGVRDAFRFFWQAEKQQRSVTVDFYERMTKALATHGIMRDGAQTPLEFAATTKWPEALRITRAYNRVRFGAEQLSAPEIAEIENWLSRLEKETGDKR